jgi:hypothetical protein
MGQGAANMEDHETRRKIIREWMALPKDKRHTEEQAAAFAKKATQQNQFHRSRRERDGGVVNHRHPSSSSIKRGMSFNLSREDSRRNGGLRRPVDCRSKGSGGRPLCVTNPPDISSVYTIGS